MVKICFGVTGAGGGYRNLMDCVAEPTVGGLISENISKCCVLSMNTEQAKDTNENIFGYRAG